MDVIQTSFSAYIFALACAVLFTVAIPFAAAVFGFVINWLATQVFRQSWLAGGIAGAMVYALLGKIFADFLILARFGAGFGSVEIAVAWYLAWITLGVAVGIFVKRHIALSFTDM